MKKFILYANGMKYKTETEEELLPHLSKELSEEVDKLTIGGRHFYNRIQWEFERII